MLAAYLFRAGIGRGEKRDGSRGQVAFGLRTARLGQAEVEELGLASSGDQNVAGLEVAMDDQIAMRVAYRIADLD